MIGLKIEYKVGGRKVPASRFADAAMAELRKEVEKEIKRKASTVRCPEHGQSAKLVMTSSSRKGIAFDVHGCCDKLVTLVQDRLK